MRTFGSLFFAICCLWGMARCEAEPVSYRLAIAPFYAPFNRDYGVFMADRIAFELFRHTYVPALKRPRFVLIETDTLDAGVQRELQEATHAISPKLLETLQRFIPANYLLTGTVSVSGIHTIDIRLLDLETGRFIWSSNIRDNPSWVWTRANREVGEIPATEVRKQLGFGTKATPLPPPEASQLPHNVLLQPFYTTGYAALAADCENRLRENIARDGLFSLVPGALKGPHGEQRFSRIGSALRRQADETTVADAILSGSLYTLGKDGSADNMAVVMRLIDVATGQLVWMGAASGRRVWRWDKQADIIAGLTASLTEELAQFGAGAAESVLAEMRENAQTGSDWVALGNAYLSRGLLRQSEEVLNKALAFPDVASRAQDGLGQIYLRRGGVFDKAVAAFKAAINADPNDLAAYCHLAQAYLDRDMPDGEKFAMQALARDSTFSLAHQVLGDWYASQEDDEKAAREYETYLKLKPDDIDVAARFGRVLIRLRDYGRINLLIAPILRAKPEATKLIPVVAITDRRERHFTEASSLFARFLTQVDARERMVYENIHDLLPGSKQAAYDGLSGHDRTLYEEQFWREKDPDLSNSYNERQLEHYERVWIARQDFGQEVYPWDRRGAVYVRYGEPDYRARSGWVTALPSTRVQEVKERAYRELYQDAPDGELIGPVFPIRSDRSVGIVQETELTPPPQTATPDDRLNAGLDRQQVTGTLSTVGQESSAPVTAQNDRSIVPWESWVYTDIEGGLMFDFTREMGGVSGYDFAPIPSILPSNLKSSIRIAEYAPAIAYQRAISSHPDDFRPSPSLPLKSFYYDVADFRGDEQHTRVDVAFGVPLSDLLIVTNGRQPQVVIDRGLALADSAYTLVYRQHQKVQLDADTSQVAFGQIVDAVRQDVPPGLYHLTLTVTDLMSGRKGKLQRDVHVDDYSKKGLELSDLMLAKSLSDTVRDIRFRRGTWQAVPNPSRQYRAPHPLAFYCEVYHLRKDTFGQAHYRVTTAVKVVDKDRPLPIGPMKQPEVALSYEQVTTQDWERLPLEVDLSNAQPGRNRLLVIVEDLNSGEKVARETYFEYIR